MQSSNRGYRDLVVWQKAIDLAVAVHASTRSLPAQERFGLIAQLNRASVSVPSNIAEGAARRTTRDFLAFVHIARGSLAEIETQLLVSHRIGYLDAETFESLSAQADEVGRMVNGLIAGLQRKVARK